MDLTRSPIILFCDEHDDGEAVTPPEFVLPEDLTAESDERLAEIMAEAVTAFDAVRDGPLDETAIAALTGLADAIDAIRAETGRREQAAEQAREAAEALAARVHGEPPPAEGEEGTPAEGAAEGDTPAGETPPVVEGEAPAPVEGEQPAPQAVAAAAAAPRTAPRSVRLPLSAIRAHAPTTVIPERESGLVITAAADLPGLSPGARVSLDRLTQAMHDRARNMGNGSRSPVATFDNAFPVVIDEEMSRSQMTAAITAAMNPVGHIVNEAGAITAAGGWCAPSERVYGYFNIAGRSGLIDVPSGTIRRGGIEFIEDGGPSISDVMAVPWLWTEANDIAALDNVLPGEEGFEDNVTKPCVRIPCPTWIEERLDAHGICVTAGNLTDRAFPEAGRNFLDLVLAANAHVINKRIIDAMVAASTAVAIAGTTSALSAALAAVDLQAADYRDKFRMDDGAVLEAPFPSWALPLFRTDLARRANVDALQVTEAQVRAQFATRNVRVQFVQDWQPLQTGAAGADGFRETWPANLAFMLYAPGTFFRGNGGTIDLGVGRDSAMNAVNDHTYAFTEELILLAKMGHESRVITLPVCPDGSHGGIAVDLACPLA